MNTAVTPPNVQTIVVNTVVSNTELVLINVTEDKLRLACQAHYAQIKDKNSWHAPTGILFGLIPVLLTAEFKDIGPLKQGHLEGLFYALAFLCTIWAIKAAWSSYHAIGVNDLVDKIKSNNPV